MVSSASPGTPSSQSRILRPKTPQHGKFHLQINEEIRRLNEFCKLNLPIRDDKVFSPQNAALTQNHKVTLRNSCVSDIVLLFFKDRSALHNTLTVFKHTLDRVLSEDLQLERLSVALKEAKANWQRTQPQPLSASGKAGVTPLPVEKATKASILHNQPIHALKGSLRQPDFTPKKGQEQPEDGRKFRLEPQSQYETAVDTVNGSPTEPEDNDVDDTHEPFETPPDSPSRRFAVHDAATSTNVSYPKLPRIDDRPSPVKKRLSNEGQQDDNYRQKFSRTSNGRRESHTTNRTDQTDRTLVGNDVRASFMSVSSGDTSMISSFGSSNFAVPLKFGRYRSGVNTADTSFATVADDAPDPLPKSSALYGSSMDGEEVGKVLNDLLDLGKTSSHSKLGPRPVKSGQQSVRPILDENLNPDLFNENEFFSSLSNDAAPKCAQKSTPERPQKSSFRIRDIIMRGLYAHDPCGTTTAFGNVPFIVRLECARIQPIIQTPYDVIVKGYLDAIGGVHSYEAFWAHMQERYTSLQISRSPKAAWDNAYSMGYTFKAKWDFDTEKSGRLFRLTLEAPVKELSCRFQRAFGANRFLYLTVPGLRSLPPHINKRRDELQERFEEWLRTDHVFLGRTWRAFYFDDIKIPKAQRAKQKPGQLRVVLFALSGCDLALTNKKRLPDSSLAGQRPSLGSSMTVHDLIDWFMPMAKHRDKKFCKIYARLSLGLSRTTPTLQFKYSQIKRVKDTMSDDTSEETRYNDSRLDWSDEPKASMEMNDGCARVSLAAAKQIWLKCGHEGAMPSAFQGRLGGAKGVWFVHTPINTADRDKIWIEITDSQLKFEFHDNDMDDKTCDEHRLTFGLVNYSRPATKSSLNLAFLPILINRGVKKDYIVSVMRAALDAERKELLDIINEPSNPAQRLRKWISDHDSLTKMQPGELQWIADLPKSNASKLIRLLEAGFLPKHNKYLADVLHRFCDNYLIRLSQSLRLPVEKSCSVLGIADPTGKLQPGQIHLSFSRKFEDRITGELYPHLHGLPALVTRHPTLRKSDIQKVDTVFCQDLFLIMDVVVFPSRGKHALANKLQGGDYDGDTFWVCWDPQLTGSFRNAPAPAESPQPAEYNIREEKRTVGDVTPRPGSITSFLRESMRLRLQENLLGSVTVAWENVCYNNLDSIDAVAALQLCDMHDLLIDWEKNGYTFTFEQFKEIRAAYSKQGLLKEPAYKTAMKALVKGKFSENMKTVKNLSQKMKSTDINDHLFFNIVIPHVEETSQLLSEALGDAPTTDESLSCTWDDIKSRIFKQKDSCMKKEARHLEESLSKVADSWKQKARLAGYKKDVGDDDYLFEERLLQCFEQYRRIRPLHPDHPGIQPWIQPVRRKAVPEWEYIKASALFCGHHYQPAFVWNVAGATLMNIKAFDSVDNPRDVRHIIEPMYVGLKPRKIASRAEQPANAQQFGGDHADDVGAPGDEDDDEGDDDTRSYYDLFDD